VSRLTARTAAQLKPGARPSRRQERERHGSLFTFKAGLGKCDVASLHLLLVAETRSFQQQDVAKEKHPRLSRAYDYRCS
jgi:hypothetical protein